MSVLLQISDPHFGTEQAHVVSALRSLAAQVKPSLVVISGDITQRARRAQFAAARAFIDSLGTRFVAIPGNHDIPLFNVAARIFAPYANYERAFGRDLEPRAASEEFLVICANTTRPSRHKDGVISAAQIRDTCDALRDATREQVRIVVTHQPVHVIRAQDRENLLHGHEQAVRAWSEAGADIVMGGHIHLPYIRPLTESFVDLPRKIWNVQAGTAVSSRVRGAVPNSINILRHAATDLVCSAERWDYDDSTGAFRCFHADVLELDRRSA